MTNKVPKTYLKDVPTGRAIAIRQPYIESILLGKKKYEYRSRPTKIRGRVFLYASKGKTPQDRWDALKLEMGSLPTGVIVGSVEIVDCDYDDSTGYYRYKLVKPKRYRQHIEPDMQAQPCFFFPFGRQD